MIASARMSTRLPLIVAVKPRTPCVNCGPSTIPTNSVKPSRNESAVPMLIAGRPRMRRSTIGRFAPRNSQITNAIPLKTAVSAQTTMPGSLNQSLRSPSSSTYCSGPSVAISSASPVTSDDTRARGGSRRNVHNRIAATKPGTTLMKNTHRHEKLSVRMPPSVGPMLGPTTAPSAKSPCAAPSCFGGNVSRRIERAAVRIPPPKSPCTTRKPISSSADCASPQHIEATVNPRIAVVT